jgi:hypothetical protein
MGHAEMLLAVAGLDRKTIDERSRHLADGDWSVFSPAEQAAFGFAHKQAARPESITRQDVEELVRRLGRERTPVNPTRQRGMASNNAQGFPLVKG